MLSHLSLNQAKPFDNPNERETQGSSLCSVIQVLAEQEDGGPSHRSPGLLW